MAIADQNPVRERHWYFSEMSNGVKLGWLIDRQNQQAFVYRSDLSITQYPATVVLSGEDVVPGFTIPLKSLL